MTETTLSIPATPPSLNVVGYRSHWTVGRREKLQWQEWIFIALLEKRVPKGLASVNVSAEMHFTQRRRRDEGNFRAILEKACGDALVAGGWLADDTPAHYRFGAVDFEAPRPIAKTILRLRH